MLILSGPVSSIAASLSSSTNSADSGFARVRNLFFALAEVADFLALRLSLGVVRVGSSSELSKDTRKDVRFEPEPHPFTLILSKCFSRKMEKSKPFGSHEKEITLP